MNTYNLLRQNLTKALSLGHKKIDLLRAIRTYRQGNKTDYQYYLGFQKRMSSMKKEGITDLGEDGYNQIYIENARKAIRRKGTILCPAGSAFDDVYNRIRQEVRMGNAEDESSESETDERGRERRRRKKKKKRTRYDGVFSNTDEDSSSEEEPEKRKRKRKKKRKRGTRETSEEESDGGGRKQKREKASTCLLTPNLSEPRRRDQQYLTNLGTKEWRGNKKQQTKEIGTGGNDKRSERLGSKLW